MKLRVSRSKLSRMAEVWALCCLILVTGCRPDSTGSNAGVQSTEVENTTVASATSAQDSALVPLVGLENSVPALTTKTTVLMRTSIGDITIDVYPQAAPNAADRFLELVDTGFYDNTPVFRVVPGFVAQFGINWRDPYPGWQDNNFDDDPVLFSHEPGTLAFAKAGPDTNSTQVFINYINNDRLAAPSLNFTVFGKVVSGMEVAEAFVPVGDASGGLDQDRLWNDGGTYLQSLDPKPVMIEEMTIVGSDKL